MRTGGAVLLLIATLVAASCAGATLRGAEPRIIAVRNRSGSDIEQVTLREASRWGNAARFATIAPVPSGATQVLVRPTDPPRLPRNVEVEWVDSGNRKRVQEVSLSSALRAAGVSADEALVIELGPRDEVTAFVESMPRRSP